MTVKELKERLINIPDDATVHAYEGEGIGLIIREVGYDFSRSSEFETWWIETEPA